MPKQAKDQLPGISLPIDFVPGTRGDTKMYPTCIDIDQLQNGQASRSHIWKEVQMMRVINDITESEDWAEICSEPEPEILARQIRRTFDRYLLAKTKETIEWVADELVWRSRNFAKTKIVNVFDGVAKSESTITPGLLQALALATNPLVKPRRQMTGNQYQVPLDPGLRPLSFRYSKVLLNDTINMDNCLLSIGTGTTLWLHDVEQPSPLSQMQAQTMPLGLPSGTATFRGYDLQQQYIPFDVSFTKNGGCSIDTYINNLHPREHSGLYGAMEELVARAIPLWNESLSSVKTDWRRLRFEGKVQYNQSMPNWQEGDRCPCALFLHFHSEMDNNVPRGCGICEDLYRDWMKERVIVLPGLTSFESNKPPLNKVNLRAQFAKKGIQVMARIEDVDLHRGGQRPGEPWHVEGALNEHICATAILCYDVTNISLRKLHFRQRSNPEPALTLEAIKEDVPSWVNTMNWRTVQGTVLGLKPRELPFEPFYLPRAQELGSVSLPEGRMVAFPSLMQHRSSQFTTADKSMPGRCKILSLFLVDPHVRIISSANVPPQRKEWKAERNWMINSILRRHLPQELVDMVLSELDQIEHVPTSDLLESSLQYRLKRRRNQMQRENLRDFEAPFPGVDPARTLDEPWWYSAFS